MKRLRGAWLRVVVATLILLPSMALAEVSVELDRRGNFKRYWYLTAGRARNSFVWRQVRPRLPQQLLLNALGDNLGDRAPAIKTSPVTGHPMAVWPKNFGNIRQLAESSWDNKNKRWTDVSLIAPGAALVYDDQDPSLAFDQSGVPYVVWSRAEQNARIYISMKVLDRWAPPMPISEEGVDGRSPAIELNGTTAFITYQTPAGPVTKHYETAALIFSAASLMDNPIPPLAGPPPGGEPPPGGGGGNDRHRN